MRSLSRNLILFFFVILGVFGQTHNLILIPNPADTEGGRVSWRERKANGTHEFRLVAPASLAADLDFTLPASDGSAYWSLTTDGGGNFEFREMVWASDLAGGTRQNITGPKTIYSQDLEFSRAARTTPQSIVFRNRASTLNGTWLMGITANGAQSQLCVNALNAAGIITCFEENQLRTYTPSRFDGIVSLYSNLLMSGSLVVDTSRNISGNDIVAGGAVTANTYIDMLDAAAPANPGVGYRRVYTKTGTGLCSRDSGGTETCYGSGGSGPPFELPFYLTVSGTDKARFYSSVGNVSMYLKNSSGITSALLSNFTGGSMLSLLDTNGDGEANLSTGNTDGAMLYLRSADTTRDGIVLAGGTFTGGGYLKSYNVSSQLVNQIDDTGIAVREPSTATTRIKLSTLGYEELYAITAPSNPSAGFGRLYYSATNGNLCIRTQFGTDTCTAFSGTYVTTDSTAQTKSGILSFGSEVRWNGSISGYVGAVAPSSVSSYTFKWPTVQSSGCLSNDGVGNTTWAACATGSYVDTSTNQNIGGIKYTTGAWRGGEIAVRASSGSANVWQSYVSGSMGVTEVWATTGGSFPTAQLVGNYSAGGTAALSFPDPSTGTNSLTVRGGSSSTFPSITFTNSSGSTRLTLGVSTVNGYINVYDNSGNIAFAVDGFGSGRIRVFDGSTLNTGQTTTVTTGSCTMTFTQGVLTAKSGC